MVDRAADTSSRLAVPSKAGTAPYGDDCRSHRVVLGGHGGHGGSGSLP
jgi:hypothetical protein